MRLSSLLVVSLICVAGCSSPTLVEIKDVCSRPRGSDVIVRGFATLPSELEITRYSRGGVKTGTSYKIVLATRPEASGDVVMVAVRETDGVRSNSIQAVGREYTSGSLILYSDKGAEILAGQAIRLTGEVVDDERYGCAVNVKTIEITNQAGF